MEAEQLSCAVGALLERHEVLRTVFRQVPGAEIPLQVAVMQWLNPA